MIRCKKKVKFVKRFLFCFLKIQTKTGTRINYKDRKNVRDPAAPSKSENGEEIFLVRGTNVNVHRAELEIKRLILDMGTLLTEEFYVPEYVCGRLIGRNGVSIKEICSISNCKVKLHDKGGRTMNSNNEINKQDLECLGENEDANSLSRKLISLTGNSEQIAKAKVKTLNFFFRY